VSKRLVEYHINRLKDKSPQARLAAIEELLLLEDPDALEALEQVYQNDPDPAVRKAAQKAGRQIFLKNRVRKPEDS
jgi:HEAT repeat protein